MITSNQILHISCEKEYLEKTIALVLSLDDYDRVLKTRKTGACLAYRAVDGIFAIGFSLADSLDKGWQTFVVEYPSPELIAQTAAAYLQKHKPKNEYKNEVFYDGGYEYGYELLRPSWGYIEDPEKNDPFYQFDIDDQKDSILVGIRGFWNYYAK